MKQVKQIIEGWAKLVYDKLIGLPPAIRDEANNRLGICNGCPVRTGNRCDPRKSGNHVETGRQTNGCGCILTAKAVSMDSECPLGKW